MTRSTLYWIFGGILGTAFVSGILYFGYQHYIQQEKLSNIQLLNQALQKDLKQKDNLTFSLEVENTELKEHISLLQDTIQMLRSEISILKKLVASQKMTIKSQTLQLEQLSSEIRMIDRQISSTQATEPKLAKLRKEKNQLVQQRVLISQSRDKDILERRKTEQDLMARRVREGRLSRIRNLVESTQVILHSIEPRRSSIGRPLTRIQQGMNHWKYTQIDLHLNHKESQLLLDEEFDVSIVEKPSGKPLMHQGPTDTASKGIRTKFTGEPIRLTYFNEENKNGPDYQVEIRYIDDTGDTYLLKNGRIPFIRNNQWISPES